MHAWELASLVSITSPFVLNSGLVIGYRLVLLNFFVNEILVLVYINRQFQLHFYSSS